MSYHLYKSDNPKKKYYIEHAHKKIYFGAAGFSDYTMHKDPERKRLYIQRHGKEDWKHLNSAGFWSRWLLWNKTTLKSSVIDTKKRFWINIIIHK